MEKICFSCKKYLYMLCMFFSIHVLAQPKHSTVFNGDMQTADSLYFAQNWHAAKDMYEQLLGDTSHNSVAWNRLGFVYYNLQLYDKAMQSYTKALVLQPAAPIKASV